LFVEDWGGGSVEFVTIRFETVRLK
jgi:hypothetical protein